MTISATDILVPVCSKIPLLYLLTQKVAQKFGYVLGIGKRQGSICHDDKWRIDPWLYGDIRNLHLSFQQLHNHLFKNSIAQSYGFIFISARVFCTYKLNIANIYFFSCEKFSVSRTFRYFCSKNKRL